MKKVYSLILLFLSLTTMSMAQQNDSLPNAATIQGLKMAFITRQIGLTTDESQKFWPVYFNYMGDLRKARQDNKNDILGMEEDVLVVRKKYKTEFKKVLVADDRVNKVLTVDRDFNEVLRKELKQRIEQHKKRKFEKQ